MHLWFESSHPAYELLYTGLSVDSPNLNPIFQYTTIKAYQQSGHMLILSFLLFIMF